MFEPSSRYYVIETAEVTTAGGRQIAYKRRRFLPQGAAMPLLVEVTVRQGERLDLIAAAALGDPQQFWRIADANEAMDPFDLTQEPGRVLRVPVPQP